MSQKRHIPIRSCVGCRTRKPKAELLRLVAVDDRIETDRSCTMQGRGCYICHDVRCLEKAVKRRAFHRALKRKNLDTSCLSDLFKDKDKRNPEAGVSE